MKFFYLLFVCILLSGCTSTSTYSTYQEWKDKQEVRAQAARMLKQAEWVTFKGTKKTEPSKEKD